MKAYVEFPLSVKLPIEEEHKIVSTYVPGEGISKSFRIEFEDYNVQTIKDNEEVIYEGIHTQLNITYIYENEKDVIPDEHNELLRGVLYNCLGVANDFLSALRFTYDLNYIGDITIYDLPEFLTIEVDNNKYLYITSPMKLIEESENLSSEEFQKVQETRATWDKYPDIALVERFYSSAKHSLAAENFLSAIIELQTSFEIFIRNTMRLTLTMDGKKQNKTEKEIKKEIENKKNISFRNLIEGHLSKKLGENLSFDKNPMFKKWNNNLYKLRNNIVHSGKYHVTDNEAKEAHDSYIEIRQYITDKLIEKKYLSKEGNVQLKFFEEIYSNPLKDAEIRTKLVELGILPSESQLSQE